MRPDHASESGLRLIRAHIGSQMEVPGQNTDGVSHDKEKLSSGRLTEFAPEWAICTVMVQ